MSALKIGLISDTHGLLRSQAKAVLTGCDHILHAGDLGSPLILEQLELIAPTTAVKGNVDLWIWAGNLKMVERLKLGTWAILLVHNIDDLPPLEDQVDVVVFGHSHRFSQEQKNGVWYINPGSAGPRRFRLPITMAVLILKEGELALERIELENKA